MIKNQINNQPQIFLEFSLPEHQTIKRILLFLKNVLPEFERDFHIQQPNLRIEDDISKQLSSYFQEKAKSENLLFEFDAKRGVDFNIHISPLKLGAASIFCIEAKRLSRQHNDYVRGETGGIERFKRECKGFGKHLSISAMIGYVQENTFEHWEQRINYWIDELINSSTDIEWNTEDKIIADDNFAHYKSSHTRVSGTSIILFHYWISLN
jgi:hypothetical protein